MAETCNHTWAVYAGATGHFCGRCGTEAPKCECGMYNSSSYKFCQGCGREFAEFELTK